MPPESGDSLEIFYDLNGGWWPPFGIMKYGALVFSLIYIIRGIVLGNRIYQVKGFFWDMLRTLCLFEVRVVIIRCAPSHFSLSFRLALSGGGGVLLLNQLGSGFPQF